MTLLNAPSHPPLASAAVPPLASAAQPPLASAAPPASAAAPPLASAAVPPLASAALPRAEPKESKLLGIELLRFLSSIAVLVFHYQHFKFVGGAPVDFVVAQQPWYGLLRLFYDNGFYGVQIFWCISGFIFYWKYAREIAQARISGYVFFILRLSRLYPLHFVTLLFMAAMQVVYFSNHGVYFIYQNNDLFHFVLQLFLASNWGLQAGDSYNGPIWSISIEVLVYAVFFLSLRYISGSTLFIGLVAAAGAAIQLLKVSEHPVFACLMFFYLGCLTGAVYRRTSRDPLARRWMTAAALLVVVALPVLTGFIDIKAKFFLVLFTPALLLLCVTYLPETRLTSRVLVPAGNMTYASYLLHVPIQIAVVTYCSYAAIRLPYYSPVFFLVFIVGTLALSHLTYEYFEMPAQKWMRRTFMTRRTVAVAGVR